MNVPWHLLVHTASITAAGYTETVGVDRPTFSSAVACPCRVEENSSRRSLEDQRLTGTWTATGYFPRVYNGSAVSIPADTHVAVTFQDGTSKTYKVTGPARHAAGHNVLNVVDMEAAT